MRLTYEEPLQRAEVQLKATRFAMFFFSWSVVHGRSPDTTDVPDDGDMETLVREAVRQFITDGQVTAQSFSDHLEKTARATLANFYWYPAEIWGYAVDEVQNLLAEELGQGFASTWLPQEAQPAAVRKMR